ncbi:MAG: bifunctional phosphopantothenoylcysteine decarboxylase/phosphopantothenate--cysteine ligase CoaBC [Thermodesulfobacteriota bacterium]
MRERFTNKRFVLGVCGGIAAYKSVELLRLLIKQGASVRVIMTRNAAAFVGPLTFETLSSQPVCCDLFHDREDGAIRHIQWAREAHAVIIAPATADMIGKLANGIADDALSTFLLAVTAPRLLCPSMNTHMYENIAVQRNIDRLEADGYRIIEPDAGELACGTTGPGRLADPAHIVDRLYHHLRRKDYSGKRVLVTAGPTREAIDPVRYISNHSSGKMGYALARAAEYRGADVTLVSGPTNLAPPSGVKTVAVVSAGDMAEAVFQHAEDADLIIKVAAVADYRPVETARGKIKKTAAEFHLVLTKNIDILAELGRRKKGRILVGFAAETGDLDEYALQKLQAKQLDMIVGNLIGSPGSGFNADTNQVTLYHADGSRETLPVMSKDGIADLILDSISARHLGGRTDHEQP